MTWVKICGMTNLEDALLAVEAGADAVGFVFHPASPRNVRPEVARDIAAKLPRSVERVGVFVGDSPGAITAMRKIVDEVALTAIQVYGYAEHPSLRTLDELGSLQRKLFIAWPAERIFKGRFGGFKWRTAATTRASAIFLDSGTSKHPGGTGKTFDWPKAAPVLSTLAASFKFIVAGGLSPENVAEPIAILKPWGVDVVSGVEASPGKKDPVKVRAFINAVRAADRSS